MTEEIVGCCGDGSIRGRNGDADRGKGVGCGGKHGNDSGGGSKDGVHMGGDDGESGVGGGKGTFLSL